MSKGEQKNIPGISQGPLFQAAKEEPAAIPPKAEFADNRELRMVDALCAHLDWLHENLKNPVEIAIATGYFNPQGFVLLADRLARLERVRLLLGAEPLPPPAIPLRMPGAPRGEKFEREIVGRELERNETGLARDRDLVPFAPDEDRTLRKLIDFLEGGRIEVRRYEKAFLHGKAFIFATDEGVISGSSNFTAAGLTSNLELNLGRYDPTPVKKVSNWFEALWNDAVPYDLASVYEARFEPYDPYLVFLRVLWERYKGELEQEADQGRIHLTTFQSDGIFRAKRIAQKYNGVLVADGVGLGKTFVGGELIRQTIEDRRQRALLIAPAALRDGPWERFRVAHSMYMETVSYEQLAADSRLGGGTPILKQDPNEYALVVVDEAQAFRNPETQRARALRMLLQGKPPKTLVLLTATPVNNSLWDLYYLLSYFIRHDASFSDRGIRSLREKFSDTVKLDPDVLSPDALFDILDATTVRRTRHFVQRYYPNDRVTDSRGREIPVVFPKPHVRQIDYSLDDALPGFFEEFEQALAPEKGEPELSLARYSPGRYRTGNHSDDREEALLGLLRSGLLKRFESSAYAFAKTAESMARAHDVFLDGLEDGVILTAEGIADWEQTDSDEAFDELVRQSGSISSKGYNEKELRADVENDRDLLRRFAKRANELKPQDDPKLKALIEELIRIDSQASKEGFDEADKCNRRKVIVFSYFADTVSWIAERLLEVLARDPRLKSYRGRIVAVSGDETWSGISRERAVFGFAPESSEAPSGMDANSYDILVTTDVLAEGVNLQQARNIINYDLPWNPMRLVQRHGRIDRIGSPHRDVFIRCFFPDKRLNVLLDLEARIRRKLAQAAATIGIEHEVIPGAATGEHVFADTREQIERLRGEDASIFETGGEDPTAHSGEEYRQELRKGLETYRDRITNLPGGAGSGFVGGKLKGHFFCAKVGRDTEKERVFLRFVPWESAEIIKDSLACLKLITCSEQTPRSMTDELANGAYTAWQRAREDIFEDWKFATDPMNLQPSVKRSMKLAAEQIRKYPPPGLTQREIDALVETIEAPWGGRIERQIREAMEGATGAEASQKIADTVKELGLEPFQPPEPWPPIGEEEITLVCWIAVDI